MAEEVKKKVLYLGLEYDSDLVDFLGLNAEAYARHRGFNEAQTNAFMNEVNYRLNNMRNGGDGSLLDTNNLEIHTGRFTGRQKEGERAWNGMSRDTFNFGDAVNNYITGGAGRFSSLIAAREKAAKAKEEAETKAKQKVWTLHKGEGDSSLGESLRTMWGNNLDMVDWADSSGDTYVDGVRSRKGRYAALNKTLTKYRDSLLNGDFGEVTPEMLLEIDLLNGVLNNGDPSQLDAAYKRLLGNKIYDALMFTGEKYMTPQEQESAKIKSELESRLKTAQDYLNGVEGVENPYLKGTKEWLDLENLRLHTLDDKFNESFGTNPDWNYSGDYTFSTDINGDAMSSDLFNGWSFSEMRNNLNAMEGGGADEHGRDRKVSNFRSIIPLTGEFNHDDYAGYNDGFWAGEDKSLKGSIYLPYLDSLKDNTNDLAADDTFMTMGANNARSTNAIKAKAAMDWARYLVSDGKHDLFMLSDGSGYLLPELIDWNTGRAYITSFNGNKGTARAVNMRDIISRLDKNSPLYRTLLNEWRTFNLRKPIAFNKEGGILKAQAGAPLSEAEKRLLSGNKPMVSQADPYYNTSYLGFLNLGVYNPVTPELVQAATLARFEHAQLNGVHNLDLEDRNNSTEFSATDYARIGTAVADLTGAVLSLSGFSAAGAAVGAGSTLTLFGLDMSDGDVSLSDALKGLGAGLTLDALSLIPVGGSFAGISKAAKTLSKYAVPIISAMLVAGNSDLAIATAKKFFNGDFLNITVGEWKGFTKALNGITNVTPMAKIAAEKRWGKLSKIKAPSENKQWTYTVGNKKLTLSEEEVAAINSSDDPLLALRAKFTSGDNALTAEQANAEITSDFITNPNRVSRVLGGKSELNLSKATASSAMNNLAMRDYISALRNVQADRQAVIALGRTPGASLWQRAKGKMTEYGFDDATTIAGGNNNANLFNLLRGKPATASAFDANLAKAESTLRQNLLKELEALMNSAGLKPLDKKAIQQQYDKLVKALLKTKDEYAKAGGDTALAAYLASNAADEGRVRVSSKLERMLSARALHTKGVQDKRSVITNLNNERANLRTGSSWDAANKNLADAQAELATITKKPGVTVDELAAANKKVSDALDALKSLEATAAAREAEIGTLATRDAAGNITTKGTGSLGKIEEEIALLERFIKLINDAASKPNKGGPSLLQLMGITAITGAHPKTPEERFATMTAANLRALKDSANKRIKTLEKLLALKKRIDKESKLNTWKTERELLITNLADTAYVNLVLGNPITNVANFRRMLADLLAKGYDKHTAMIILRNPKKMEAIRKLYEFKKGGKIRKALNGTELLTSGIETSKLFDSINASNRAADIKKSVPALLYSALLLNYTPSTKRAGDPYFAAATLTLNFYNNLANNYASPELLASLRAAGFEKGLNYNLLGSLAILNSVDLDMAKLQEVNRANQTTMNNIAALNAQLRNSKQQADAAVDAARVLHNASQLETFKTQVLHGINAGARQRYEAKKTQALNNDPEYMQAKDELLAALTAYKNDPSDANKTALQKANRAVLLATTNFNELYDAQNPLNSGVPFAFSSSYDTYKPNFWNGVTWTAKLGGSIIKRSSGGEVGKLTLAELVKLFRQKQINKFKENKAYRDYLDKYATRSAKINAGSSTAYNAYIKLLNSK